MAELENRKHERFCQEYIIDLNATQAAIRAGYSKNTAEVTGARLLRNVKVKNRISELSQEIKATKIADAAEVMEFLSGVIRGEKKEQIAMMGADGSIIYGDKVMSGREQVKAAELLAKRYGLLTENVKLNGSAVVQIVDDLDGDKNNG